MNDDDTTETLHGLCVGVRPELVGSALEVAVFAGSTTLQVVDAVDFNPKGGWVRLGGQQIVEYSSADIDADLITLAAALVMPPAVATWEVDDRVDVWDVANGSPAVRYKASIDQIDGFPGKPVDVEVDQGIAHVLATSMRVGAGDSVTLRRDGGGLRVVGVDGRQFALAALQYIQEGMTTRQSDDEAGVDVLGAATGTPGIFAFGVGGQDNPTVIIDALTGDATFIGELGTALPGDVGIFMYSIDFQKLGDRVVTRPVMQFNTGATRDQPSIQSDSATTPNLLLFSGATTGGRETMVQVQQGSFQVGLEADPDDELYLGATLILERDGYNVFTDRLVGPSSNHKGVDLLQDNLTHHGYQNPGTGALRGFGYNGTAATDFARIYTANKMDVVSEDASTFKGINASAFTVSSDRRHKKNPAPVDGGALELLAQLTVYDYDAADPDVGTTRGVMAQDVAAVLPNAVADMPALEGQDGPSLGVDLYALLATTIAAVQELSAERDSSRAELQALRVEVAALRH